MVAQEANRTGEGTAEEDILREDPIEETQQRKRSNGSRRTSEAEYFLQAGPRGVACNGGNGGNGGLGE